MTNFEKITKTPEALSEFLSSLSQTGQPWSDEQEQNACDTEACIMKWLEQNENPSELAGLSIKLNTAFPIDFGREYYIISAKCKETRAPCDCCEGTGKVTIKGAEYTCPKYEGNWRNRTVTGTTNVYRITKLSLRSVTATVYGVQCSFKKLNDPSSIYLPEVEITQADFKDMVVKSYGRKIKIYNDYKEVLREVKRLNAEEQERLKAREMGENQP